MKKNLLITLPIIGVIALAAFVGCNPSASAPSTSSTGASAEKNSFKEVTSQLDAGGDFYLYLSTEKILENLSTKLAAWRQTAVSLPDMDEKDRENVGKGFDVVTSVIKESGIEEISGLGSSSIATEKGFYHSRGFLHHYPDHGSGLLWKSMGQKPHALDGLELLSTNTVLAAFSDGDLPMIWSFVQNQVNRSGFDEAKDFLATLPGKFEEATGLKWQQVLDSLGGEYGFALTLDPSKTIQIPSTSIELPEPGLLLVLRIKDDLIFNRVDQLLNQTLGKAGMPIAKTDNATLKMRTVPVPLPLPIELRPSIASSGGYLLISTSDAVIQDALAVKAGQKPGLKSSEEFKHLARNTPTEGNQFAFMSERFGRTLIKLQGDAFQAKGPNGPPARQMIHALLSAENAGYFYSVSEITPEGWLTTANGNQGSGQVLIASMIAAPIGMIAAIAVPNFIKARTVAQQNGCINNLRIIDAAKQQWALENNKKETDEPTWTDLQSFLSIKNLHCPQGGRYAIHPVNQMPTCTIPGHVLN